MSTDTDPFAPAAGVAQADRPTPKMLNYIKALQDEREVPNRDALIPLDKLTYHDGKNMINYLLALPRKPETVVDPGWYLLDDTVWWVRIGKQSGRPYASKLAIFRNHETREVVGSEWEFVRGGIKLLHGCPRMTKEQAIAFGAEFHVCPRCGEILTHPESIARGMGPICATKEW